MKKIWVWERIALKWQRFDKANIITTGGVATSIDQFSEAEPDESFFNIRR